MKRLLLDVSVVILFVAEYFCEQAVAGRAASSTAFLILNPLVISIAVASIAAFTRGIAEQRLLNSPVILLTGLIEWICLVFVSYVLTCLLDVQRHPPESFMTVFGFSLFIVLIPTLIVSTGAYIAGRGSAFRKKR